MSSDEREPPRLRSLEHELPVELSRALESSPDEEAKPADLEALRASMARFRAAESAKAVRLRQRRQPAIFRRSVVLAMTLAIGAGAGVAVSQGVLRDARDTSPAPTTTAARTKPPVAGSTAGARRAGPALPVAPAPSAAPEPTPAVSGSPRPRTTTAERTAVPSSSPSVPAAPVEGDELALLARAQAALATDPGTALELTATHARTLPGGLLAQEREVIAIDALSRLGRRAEAAARAQRFHQRFPASAHARRVEVLVSVSADAGAHHN